MRGGCTKFKQLLPGAPTEESRGHLTAHARLQQGGSSPVSAAAVMVDRGPLLTSAIIFYLSIGAAIFHVLEEPNWKQATKEYDESKTKILDKYTCLSLRDLEEILETVSNAAGQGVTITGNTTFNNWNWANAVIFAATVITTIGYGNIAPKTSAGRLFCIFYGLFGVPLCLTWISSLGKFFAGRAKRLGQFLTKKGVTPRKAQITCTAIFILWGVVVHFVIPPLIFMRTEGWNYIEGLYFSFITITTIGFGDYVAGVNPKVTYGPLYRYFVEIWIYLGLAWLSLFVNWKVSMFVEVHKAIKKRRKKRKGPFENDPRAKRDKQMPMANSKEVNILSFLCRKEETYNDLIKQIGKNGLKNGGDGILNGDLPGNVPNKGKDMMVVYTKRNGYGYDAVTFSNGQEKENGVKPLQDKEATIFINQLDRISEEEGEPWESKDYKPLIFQNNITFVNEEEEEEEEEEDGDNSEDEEKSKSSIEENIEDPETPTGLDTFTCLDESSLSSNDIEVSVPYEQLLNEYNIMSKGET